VRRVSIIPVVCLLVTAVVAWGSAPASPAPESRLYRIHREPRSPNRDVHHPSRKHHHRHTTATELAPNIGTLYGTFDSQSQRVVYVPNGGMFVSYLSHYNSADQTQCLIYSYQARANDGCQTETVLKVSRSTDGGRMWTEVLMLGIAGNYVPPLEADSAGDVFAFVNDWGSEDGAWVYKFSAHNWNRPSLVATLPLGNADKVTSAYDPSTNTLWYIKGNYTASSIFRVWKLNAATVSGTQRRTYTDMITRDCGSLVRASGTTCGSFSGRASGGSYPLYPHIYADRSRSGLTLMAWTNSVYSSPSYYYYYDIHYIISPNHGTSWYGAHGRIKSWPIVGDDDGPSWRLLSRREYVGHCCDRSRNTIDNNWLENVYVQDGHLYFMYTHQTDAGGYYTTYRRVTPRYNRSSDTYTITNASGPTAYHQFRGGSGFFSGHGMAHSRLFFTGTNGAHILTLSSTDDGATWRSYAVSGSAFSDPYAVSGDHALGPSGEVLGAFTDEGPNNVWFFHS
jgi:hypothetical protein